MMGWMAPLRHLGAKMLAGRRPAANGEPSMGEITIIGVDLAKHVFQVHGVDEEGATVLRKQLRRGQVLAFFSKLPPCIVGLEACATAHYWARELVAPCFYSSDRLRYAVVVGPGRCQRLTRRVLIRGRGYATTQQLLRACHGAKRRRFDLHERWATERAVKRWAQSVAYGQWEALPPLMRLIRGD
jgi:hypothetical protein